MPHQMTSLSLGRYLAAVLCALTVTAPRAAPTPVVWTLLPAGEPASVRPGDRLDVMARATIEDGWYVYAMTQRPGGPTPLRITVPDEQPFAAAGPVTGPEPTIEWDAAFEIEAAKHDGIVSFTVPVQVAASAAAGKASLQVQVRYQACSDTLCLRPTTEILSLPIEVRARGPA